MRKIVTDRVLYIMCLVVAALLAPAAGQDLRWARQYNQSDEDDEATAIAIGGDGSIYVAGNTEDASNVWGVAVIKYSPTGDRLWVNNYKSPCPNGEAWANAVACSPAGDMVVVVGRTENPNDEDMLVSAINTANGQTYWTVELNGNGFGNDEAHAVAIDSDGKTYVAGWLRIDHGGQTNYDLAVICLSAQGTSDWTYTYNDVEDERALDMVLGTDDNLYVAGYTETTTADTTDNLMLSLTTGGALRWTQQRNGAGHGNDRSYAIERGADGNLYAAGFQTGSDGSADQFVESRTSDGTGRWAKTWNATGGYDKAWAITTRPDGNVYVAGQVSTLGGGLDISVWSLTSAGTHRWHYVYDGSTHENDDATDICGRGGLVYVAGTATEVNNGQDFRVTALDVDDGSERWVWTFDEGTGDRDEGVAVAVTPTQELIAAGEAWYDPERSNFMTVCLDPFTSIAGCPVARTSKVSCIAPNPFEGIARAIGQESDEFEVLDGAGRTRGRCRGREIGRGLPAGVYFIRATDAADLVRVVKLR